MTGNCFICNQAFVKTGKNYNRYRIGALCSQDTFLKVFPLQDSLHNSVDADAFLCTVCVDYLNKKTIPDKPKKPGKRSIRRVWPATQPILPPDNNASHPSRKRRYPDTSSPSRTSPTHVIHPKKRHDHPHDKTDVPGTRQDLTGNGGFTQKAADYITSHQYERGFRLLSACSNNAKNALIKVVQCIIKNERKTLQASKSQTAFEKKLTPETIKSFDWDDALSEIREVAPVTVSTMRSMFPDARAITGQRIMGSKKKRRKQTLPEAETFLNVRIGTALSIVLFTRNPQRFKFLQCAIGVEAWRQGSSQKMVSTLNRMGVSQGSSAARDHVDRLCANHDSDILLWKSTVQENLSQEPKSFNVPKKLEMTTSNKLEKNCSYGVCWDNVQIEAKAVHQGLEKSNSFLMWGLTFGIGHRVPTLHLLKDDTCDAKEVDVSAFVPSNEDYRQLRVHMEHVVVQVLSRNLDCLQHLTFPRHLQHHHTKAMNQQSNVVNLGVVASNPSSTDGTIDIMEHLYKYVPVVLAIAILILCNGDGMSIERMIHAHLGRANGWEHDKQLSGLVESPQEFHKEVILLQDFMDLLFRGTSKGDRGTLAQFKQEFNHRSLKTEVKDNVQQVWDMVQFATDGYVTKCALHLRQASKVDDLPASFPANGTPSDQREWVQRLAAEVVDFCWAPPSEEDLAKIRFAIKQARDNCGEVNGNGFGYCCMEDKDDTMVQCCSWICPRMWLHLDCAGLQEAPPEDDDWFCSPACSEDGTYIYCFCHERRGGLMIRCTLGADCKGHEWYHKDCIDSTQDTEGKWYCSEKCALDSLNDDQVLNHTKALMWLGLNLVVRRDAVREGNGPEMIQHWKMDLMDFWQRGHPKYFIIGHQLLANVGGFMPEHIREDLIWNRLGNLKGEPGRNIGLDLINEFLNCDFKEMLKNSRGRYTDAQVARCAQMGGAYGKQMDRLFTLSGLGQFDTRPTYARQDRYQEDIRAFCEDYEEDALFSYLPGIRTLEGFQDFHYTSDIQSPEKMGQKLSILSNRMDSRKALARRARVQRE